MRTDQEVSSEYSTDDRAELIMGKRDVSPNTVLLFAPVEQGYACPVHGIEDEDQLGDTLHWSEYNAYLWCEPCNKDYPSALCATGGSYNHRDESTIDTQIRVYLDTVQDAVARATAELTAQLAAVTQPVKPMHTWIPDEVMVFAQQMPSLQEMAAENEAKEK